MKNYSIQSRFVLMMLLILVPFFKGKCQLGTHVIELTTGEKISCSFTNMVSPGAHIVYYVTYKRVFGYSENFGDFPIYTLPDTPDVYIVRGVMKQTGDFFGRKQYLILQLSNSNLVMLNISNNSIKVITPANTTAYSRVLDIAGDDLYQIVQSGISYYTYVSHDTGATWLYDTLGLSSLQTLYNLALDSSQNVYLSAANGLYKQAPLTTTWTLTGCPAAPVSYVYADGMNRVWAFGYNSGIGANVLYYSSDEGSTWHLDTAGLYGAGMNIINMGTDPYGNVYAIGQSFGIYTTGGNVLYKSTGGTSPFARIDAGILALNAQSGDSAIFNSVVGDSAYLYAATNIGTFVSADGGSTWQPGVPVEADNCYGLAVANNGSLIASTDLGCFIRPAGDTTWTKVFPQSGYAGGQRVWRDDAGTLYSGASMSNPWNTHFLTTFVNAKSTDNGQTWSLDTNGSSAISQYSWWVDEAGNEYAGGYGKNWVKKSGTPWAIDTDGVIYAGAYDPLTAFGSDHNGTVYCAVYSGNIFSRNTNGTSWAEESGLGGDPVYTFAHTSTHTMVAGGTGNVHYKTSGSWQNMPINSPAPQGTYPYIVAVDDSDNVWTAFSHIGSAGLNQGDGVFFTPDLGAHWYPAGGQVMLITFQWLVPSGDSVFGVTYGSGVYVFNRDQSTGIREVSSPYHMNIQPNPSSTACTVTYDIAASSSQTEVVVFDMSGKELKHIAAVGQTVNMRTDDLATGDYLCALRRSGNIIAVEKLVVK